MNEERGCPNNSGSPNVFGRFFRFRFEESVKFLCKMMIYSMFSSFLRRTGNKKGALEKGSFVRIKGLEPPRRKASDPKSDVATNYTISARYVQRYIKIHKSQSGAGIIRLFYLLL